MSYNKKSSGQKIKNPDSNKNRSTGGSIEVEQINGTNYALLPLAFVLMVVPLILFIKFTLKEDMGLGDSVLFADSEWFFADLFLYYKGFFFVLAAIVMIGFLVLQAYKNRLKLSFAKIFIPLAVYMLFSFISSLASVNKAMSFKGGYQQYESIWVLLGYGIVVYYAAMIIKNTKDIETLFTFLTIGTVIMLVIGCLQLLHLDPLKFNLFEKFTKLGIPKEYRDNINIDYSHRSNAVFMTLYNPNYVGSYVSLLSPIFLLMAFREKKPLKILLSLAIFGGLLLVLLGSGSRAGFIGVITAILLLVIIYNRQLLKFWSEAILVIVLLLGIVITMNNYSNNGLINRFKSAFLSSEKTSPLTDIRTENDNVTLTYKGNTVQVFFKYHPEEDTYNIEVYDDNGTWLNCKFCTDSEYNQWCIDDTRFDRIRINWAKLNDLSGMTLSIDGFSWNFLRENNSLYYLNDKLKLVKLTGSESFKPLAEHSGFASKRGYLWSKTIPLLKNHIFIGSGPDTFMLEYPCTDYLSQLNSGFEYEIVTKPHNMYLQIGVQTGIVSLVAFLAFYVWFFIFSLKSIKKTEKKGVSALIGIGILCGTFGYMVVGLINDSTVAVAPLFWALTGIGIANCFIINRQTKSEESKA